MTGRADDDRGHGHDRGHDRGHGHDHGHDHGVAGHGGSAGHDAPHADAPHADAPHDDAPHDDAPHDDAPRADSRRGAVVVASNRAAAGVYEDTAGPVLVAGLRAAGFTTPDPVVVPDGDPVGEALREALAGGADVVLTTGGTGLSPTDATPEQTRPLLEREVPGIADALRARGVELGVASAVLSRGLAGTAGRALVVNVAGSPGACRDAVEVLTPLLGHVVSQLRGGDHPQAAPAPAS